MSSRVSQVVSLLAAEASKVRRSFVWVVVAVLPVLAVANGGTNYALSNNLPRRWESYASQVMLFYSLFYFSLGVSLLVSALWRTEHRGTSWNAMRTTPHSTAAVVLAKTAVAVIPVAAMQVLLLLLTWVLGMALGLGPALPPGVVASCTLGVVASLPLVAVQSLLSMLMRSFAAPVAVCLGGTVIGFALFLRQPGAISHLWPQTLITQALSLRSSALVSPMASTGSLWSDALVLLGWTAVGAAAAWGLLALVASRRQG